MATKAKKDHEAETQAAEAVEVDAPAPAMLRAALAEDCLSALAGCESEAQLLGVARTFADRARRAA